MIRKIVLAGAATAIAVGGLAVMGGSAGAAPPTVTSVTSADFNCKLAATKASVIPALKNNWVKANHNGVNDVVAGPAGSDPRRVEGTAPGLWNDTETNVHVKALNDTKFSTDGNNTVSSKSKSASCTGTVTQTGVGTFPVKSLGIQLSNFTFGTDNPPINTDNTCQGLLAGNQVGDTAATYKAALTLKLDGAKVSGTTNTTGLALIAGGGGAIGFQISGGTTTGVLAGSNSVSTAYVTNDVLTAIGATPSKSTAPTQTKLGSQCEASLKLKADKPTKPGSATLKGPKGLKKILVGNNVLNPAQASNICVRKGTTCPTS